LSDHSLAVQVQMDAEEVLNGLNEINNMLSNLPGSVEVDFTSEDAITPILESIQEGLNSLPSDVEIAISAFDDFATETITNLKDLVEALPSEVNVNLTAEDNASDLLDSLKEKLSEEFNITLNVEDNATETLTNLKNILDELPSTVDISLNVEDNATEIIERLHELLGDIPDEVTTTVNAEVNEGEVEDLKTKLEEIDGTTYDATVNVDTESIETAAETTNTFNGAIDGLTSKVAGLTAGFLSYNKTLELLDYNRIIEQSAILTNATQSQREAMEDLIRENYVYSLGMKGTASVMYTLAAYTNDVNLTMGYFKAALLGVKRSGEDATAVTLALARIFRDFNVNVQESTDTVNLLLGLWRVSGYSSFTQFIDTVDRLGYFFRQAGLSVEDTARIIASVGPVGTRLLRPFAKELTEISREWERGGTGVQEYGDKLEKFGVAVKDAHGNIRPFRDVLFDFIEVLSRIPDQQERVRVATEVFGESVGPALAQVASNWKTTGKVTEEESERMNKALGKSAEKHRDILGWIRYYLDQFVIWLNDFFGDMGLIGESLLVGVFTKAAEYLAEGLKRLIPRVTGAIRRLLSDGFDELKGRLPEELSRRLIDTLSEGFDKAAGKAKDIIKGFIDTIKRILGDETGRLTPKIEIPAEFKFKLPKIDLTIGDTQIDDAARTLLERFTGGVDDAARVSIPKLGSRIGSLLIRGIGEGVGIALLTVDILANFREYLNRALSDPTSILGPTPLSLIGPTPFTLMPNLIKPIKEMFSPEKILERIYGPEKWSKLKEVLMQNSKTYIEDPIREELSKLFQDPGRYIIEGFGQVWNDFKVWVMTHIPSFKWPRLPNISMPNLVALIQQAWNKFLAWVKEHVPKFKWPKLPSPSMPNLVALIQQAWNKFLAWVKEHVPKFKWPKLPSPSMPNLVSLISKVWSSFTSWIKSRFSGFKWPKLPLPDFSGIAAQFRSWGSSFISNLAAGIRSAIPNLNSVLSIIRRLLPSSPPKEGPLSTLTYGIMHEYGYLLGTHFNRGLSATIPGTVESLGKPSLVMPSDVTAGRGSSMLMGGLNLQINTNVSVDKIESEVDVDDMARRITDKVKGTMREELNRQGIPSYLYGRGYVTGVR
jgi:RNase P/RNase MRP subunit POP5